MSTFPTASSPPRSPTHATPQPASPTLVETTSPPLPPLSAASTRTGPASAAGGVWTKSSFSPRTPGLCSKDLNDFDFDGIDKDLERFQQDELVKQALSRGVELKGYSAQIEQELKEVEMESVKEYVQQSSNVAALHGQIQSCDMILARMQEMLLGFQADLGGISDEIRHLQEESRSMSIKLQNRRDVEAQLQKFLDKMVLPPDMVSTLTGKEVSDAYMEYIVNLNSKLAYISQTRPAPDGSSLDMAPKETAAGKEMAPKLEKLRLKAVAKGRDYFLQRIAELRNPKTHVQMVQQHGLLKYKHLYKFLVNAAPEVAEDVRTTYVETMGKTVFSLFRAYHAQLQKLVVEVANKNDLIAVEESAVRGLFSSRVDLGKRGDAFSLGGRDQVLGTVEDEPILVHIAQAQKAQYPYEVCLRSVFKHLTEAATCEFLFCHDFFDAHAPEPAGQNDSGHRGTETFNAVFARTLSLCLENLENYLFNCYDAISLLLMIRLTIFFRRIMQRRRIPVLDAFYDRVTMLLWPRFKAIFDANLKSVRTANAKKLGGVDLHPHYVSRRYAEFTATCLALHAAAYPSGGYRGAPAAVLPPVMQTGGEDMLLHDVSTLTREILTLLQRLAERQRGIKERYVFLINNCDQILNVFHERRVEGEERRRFEEALAHQRELFVEEELKTASFGRLIAFVKDSEATAASALSEGREGPLEVDAGKAEQLVREFAASWKAGIEAIYRDVMAYFANFKNGMEILKQVLTQLLLYYTRFQEILKKAWPRDPPAFAQDVVQTSQILSEIRKYNRTF